MNGIRSKQNTLTLPAAKFALVTILEVDIGETANPIRIRAESGFVTVWRAKKSSRYFRGWDDIQVRGAKSWKGNANQSPYPLDCQRITNHFLGFYLWSGLLLYTSELVLIQSQLCTLIWCDSLYVWQMSGNSSAAQCYVSMSQRVNLLIAMPPSNCTPI